MPGGAVAIPSAEAQRLHAAIAEFVLALAAYRAAKPASKGKNFVACAAEGMSLVAAWGSAADKLDSFVKYSLNGKVQNAQPTVAKALRTTRDSGALPDSSPESPAA